MIDYLIENFVSFAGIYAQIIINLYLFGVAVLFALWLKPFTRKHISAYLAPFVYCVLMIGTGFVETSRGIGRIINLSILVITFLILWLFDNRRNPIQKIFLCAIFRLISWLSLELFIEIGYFETELINHFEWYKYSIEATKNTTDPKISIVSVVKARFFIICVKNTVSNKVSINEEGIPESTKTETGHGYGLKNIRSIARKYKGDIDIRQDETDGGLLFVLNIMLMG